MYEQKTEKEKKVEELWKEFSFTCKEFLINPEIKEKDLTKFLKKILRIEREIKNEATNNERKD